MTTPTQTRFPRVLRREHEPHAPSQAAYVRIAVFLAAITGLEVTIYYPSFSTPLKVVGLVFLAAIKFSTVVAFFMHLRFDGRLLTFIFAAGLILAGFAFTVAVITIRGMP